MKKKGFTLIELLVVISVIGILATIVVGFFAGARKKGKDARVLIEVKQFKNALEVYYLDKGHYPIVETSDNFVEICDDFTAEGTEDLADELEGLLHVAQVSSDQCMWYMGQYHSGSNGLCKMKKYPYNDGQGYVLYYNLKDKKVNADYYGSYYTSGYDGHYHCTTHER